jgi:hypothetical protein
VNISALVPFLRCGGYVERSKVTEIVIPQLTYLPLSPGRKFAAKTPPFLSSIIAGISCWVQMIHGIFHSRSEDALDLTGASMCPSFSYYFKDSFSPLNSHKPLSPKRLPRCPSRGGIIEIFVVSHMTQRENVNGVITSLTASGMLIHVRSGSQCL